MKARPVRLTLLIGLVAVSLVTVGLTFAALAQENQVQTYDPLTAFVGTWTARTQGESTPYLVLRLKESDGKLTGTTTHLKMKVADGGGITGSPEMPGESPLGDLKVWGSDLTFIWDGDSRLQSVEAKFMVQGTEQALLVLILLPEKMKAAQEIFTDSHGAPTGFSPVISLSREMETDDKMQTESSVDHWEAGFMASLINTAEAQYKFTNGRYADYRTLLHSGQLKETVGHEFTLSPTNLESETDPLPGYRLCLLIPQDASSYQLSIREKTTDCGWGFFSDETGVIFEGHFEPTKYRSCRGVNGPL